MDFLSDLLSPLSDFFFFILEFIHETLGISWSWSIVILTVIVRIALIPLTWRQIKSMRALQALAPEIKALQEKYKDNKQLLNQKTMEFYQENKVSPFGSCLPLLLQMPVWLALYATLQTSVELYRQPFLWVKDLTAYDPFYILPLAMGASSFVMQKISPQPADNAQAKMLLYFMPAFFTFIMLKLPAGLTLYIFVNNLLSIAQQQWIMRKDRKATAAAAAAGK